MNKYMQASVGMQTEQGQMDGTMVFISMFGDLPTT